MTGPNGVTARGKRKQKEAPAEEDRTPPPKQQKTSHKTPNRTSNRTASRNSNKIASGTSNGAPIPETDQDTIEEEMEDCGVAAMVGAPADAEWQKTIEAVVRNVVSVRFCQTCAFDTEPALSSEATGFVVDAERGYILTNRHVVGSGPFWGYCIFDNHEEVDVYPVYRDPVHDFGLLRFDPSKIKYMEVAALELRPDLAKVGVEIRVVGNDAGEKLSILSGVISRLDRNAPEYGEGYCDFNTNYIQAAAAASGGSSGSPVVNIDGYAVALQAGGRTDGAATDYFLPLDRPLRALRCIQNREAVSRGTIQTQFLYKPFDECRRLGLNPEWEQSIRTSFPKETGALVAEIVLPEGPSDTKIEEGDVLIKVNNQLLTQFVVLDDILDSSVGKTVQLLLQRGGEDVSVEVEVGDLHKITPDRFVSIAGSSFHDLSYQQARLFGVPVKGVYVCEGTGSFRFDSTDNGWIILTADHKPTPDLDTFIEVMKVVPDKSRIVVTYKHLHDLHTLATGIAYIDRHWSTKIRMATRNDETGLWDFEDLADALPALPQTRKKGSFITLDNAPPAASDIVRSFVRVACNMPAKLDGFPRNRKFGVGLVIDAEKGLVVVSRAIVPYDLCDISITIADSVIVDGKVVFLHPLQNYAIIQYDPSLVEAPVVSATLSSTEIQQGASTYFVGFNQNMKIVFAKTTVTDITAVAIPANPSAPRYRALNVNAITVDTNLSQQCGHGVLVDENGTVSALWLTYLGDRSAHSNKDTDYHLGLATPTLLPVIKQLQAGKTPKLRMLSVEFQAIQMSQARIMGISEEWISKVALDNTARHQLFMVRKRTFERDGKSGALMEGDVILTLNGKIITRVSELDVMYDHEVLDAVIVRCCQEKKLKVQTVSADDLETDRLISFCGAILHRPHLAVRQQISKLHSEVYVSSRARGSPAALYGLVSTNFITHVNGEKTTDLESFIKAVIKIPDNTYFRLKAVTFDNIPWVITMKKMDHYFPMIELIKDASELSGWRRITYEKGEAVRGEGHEGIISLPLGAVEADGEGEEMVE